MRRDYTVAEYLERFDRLRAARPGIAITTDFIVGFPGETDEDFEASLRLLEQARFDQSFSFVFSPRPHTVAGLRIGSAPEWQEVPREVAVERLERLLAVQRRHRGRASWRPSWGRCVEVLVEGPSDRPGERLGRTPREPRGPLWPPARRRRRRARWSGCGSPGPGRARSRDLA